MLAAAATLWVLFSVWLLAPHIGVARTAVRATGMLLAAEFVALLVWSYGTEACDDRICAPLAQAAGVAARTDLPVLSVVVVVLALRTATGPGTTTARRMGGPSKPA